MNALLPENAVILKEGHAVTTSLKVAEIFGKKHKHVVDSIRKLVAEFSATKSDGSEFWRSNFGPSNYVDDRGKTQPLYEITRDGFTLLVMGFTGAEAMKFKIAYINRFNEMEAVLKEGFVKPLAQVETYWFTRRPHWPPIRVRVLAGETYRVIADTLQISRGRVARAVRSMINVGLLDPGKVAEAQRGPARKAALRYGEKWGQQMLPLFG